MFIASFVNGFENGFFSPEFEFGFFSPESGMFRGYRHGYEKAMEDFENKEDYNPVLARGFKNGPHPNYENEYERCFQMGYCQGYIDSHESSENKILCLEELTEESITLLLLRVMLSVITPSFNQMNQFLTDHKIQRPLSEGSRSLSNAVTKYSFCQPTLFCDQLIGRILPTLIVGGEHISQIVIQYLHKEHLPKCIESQKRATCPFCADADRSFVCPGCVNETKIIEITIGKRIRQFSRVASSGKKYKFKVIKTEKHTYHQNCQKCMFQMDIDSENDKMEIPDQDDEDESEDYDYQDNNHQIYRPHIHHHYEEYDYPGIVCE